MRYDFISILLRTIDSERAAGYDCTLLMQGSIMESRL